MPCELLFAASNLRSEELRVDLNLVEIFASAQGEGPYVGASTIFVRLGGCDLRCSWCDSPGTWRPAKKWRLEPRPGTAEFVEQANPATLDQVSDALARLDASAYRFVSVTGGEPLLQATAVEAIGKMVRDLSPRFLLETHGLAVEAMRQVRSQVDVVSMDWKLAKDVRFADATIAAETPSFHEQHEEFLVAALEACEVYVKVVVTAETQIAELEEIAKRIRNINAEVPLILQPVTPIGKIKTSPGAEQMLPLMRACERVLHDVRVIPQTHRVYGAL
jgi:7-carboxy-7-deazaguanine synthase